MLTDATIQRQNIRETVLLKGKPDEGTVDLRSRNGPSQFPLIQVNPPVSNRIRLNPGATSGIGLGEADSECKNSLILLVIQHFCGTILQDDFTMVS